MYRIKTLKSECAIASIEVSNETLIRMGSECFNMEAFELIASTFASKGFSCDKDRYIKAVTKVIDNYEIITKSPDYKVSVSRYYNAEGRTAKYVFTLIKVELNTVMDLI